MADDINYIDDLYRRTLRKPEEVITLPKDYGPLQVDQSKILLEAYRQGLEPQIAQQKALEESVGSQIKAIGEMKSPERSDLADAIMLLGAPLLGALGGEAGALSAPKAYAGASDIYEKQLKAAEEKAAAKRKLGYERLEEDKKRLATLGTEIAKGRMAGGEKLAEMEYKKTQAENELKKAKIMAQVQQDVRPPSEGERKGAYYLTSMLQAEKNLKDLKEKYGEYPSVNNKWFRTQKEIASGAFGTTLMSDFLNTKIIDEPTRQQIQAEIQFLEAVGRIKSGAAITMKEWSQFREPYFATSGDSPDIIKQKDQARQKEIEGFGIIAGKARGLIKPPEQVISNKVKVSNGIETYIIDRKDLSDATKEGFKEVK